MTSCVLFMGCSYTNNSDCKERKACKNNKNEEIMEHTHRVIDSQIQCKIQEDSLMSIIDDQFSKGNVAIEYYNISGNTKKIVPAGYVRIPDSIAYEKVIYKNGDVCCEGLAVFSESIEYDGVEVGIWKYCTPDGTKFEKEYKFSFGIKTDSI